MANADLIIAGARAWTGDPARPAAEAVAVRGDRIAFVGGAAGALELRGPATRVVDAAGATLLPGIIDSHYHLLLGSLKLDGIRLAGARTFADVAGSIPSYAARHPGAPWLAGYGLPYQALAVLLAPPARRSTPWRPSGRWSCSPSTATPPSPTAAPSAVCCAAATPAPVARLSWERMAWPRASCASRAPSARCSASSRRPARPAPASCCARASPRPRRRGDYRRPQHGRRSGPAPHLPGARGRRRTRAARLRALQRHAQHPKSGRPRQARDRRAEDQGREGPAGIRTDPEGSGLLEEGRQRVRKIR